RRQRVARGRRQQLEVALDRVDAVGGLDRMRKGTVDPHDPAAVFPRPDWGRQCLDQGPQALDFAFQVRVPGGKIDELALRAADISQAQHRAPAYGAPGGLDRTL